MFMSSMQLSTLDGVQNVVVMVVNVVFLVMLLVYYLQSLYQHNEALRRKLRFCAPCCDRRAAGRVAGSPADATVLPISIGAETSGPDQTSADVVEDLSPPTPTPAARRKSLAAFLLPSFEISKGSEDAGDIGEDCTLDIASDSIENAEELSVESKRLAKRRKEGSKKKLRKEKAKQKKEKGKPKGKAKAEKKVKRKTKAGKGSKNLEQPSPRAAASRTRTSPSPANDPLSVPH